MAKVKKKSLMGEVSRVAHKIPKMEANEEPKKIGAILKIWKQGPENELGMRRVYVHGEVSPGPADSQLKVVGGNPVKPNEQNIFLPGKEGKGKKIDIKKDKVHTYAVARQVLTMYQRLLQRQIIWSWNIGLSVKKHKPLKIIPRAGLQDRPLAFFSPDDKAVKFYSSKHNSKEVFTCRSFDIVAHEVGHAVLDALKPEWKKSQNIETQAIVEAFADLTAIFTVLAQLDLVEHVIAETHAHLYDKTCLSEIGEEIGNILGRDDGVRNAQSPNKLVETLKTGKVYEISKVFTAAIYSIMADYFSFQRRARYVDDAIILYQSAQYTAGLLLRGIALAPDDDVRLSELAKIMMDLAQLDFELNRERNCVEILRKHFKYREIIGHKHPKTENIIPVYKKSGTSSTMQNFYSDD